MPTIIPFLQEESSFIKRTLIDTEAFCIFAKNFAHQNESILQDFTKLKWNAPISLRIPLEIETPAPGFDAAIGCLLGFVPEEHIVDIMRFHTGQYDQDLINKMKTEVDLLLSGELPENIDSCSTFWWLAMSSLCKDGYTTTETFYNQYHTASMLSASLEMRYDAAHHCATQLTNSFQIDEKTSLPFGTIDGCLQASYLAGYEVATMYAEKYDLYFLGTYVPGKFDRIIKLFQFSEAKDDSGKTKSGVINSTFLKFENYTEMQSAIALL
jgi:hypothetical protein